MFLVIFISNCEYVLVLYLKKKFMSRYVQLVCILVYILRTSKVLNIQSVADRYSRKNVTTNLSYNLLLLQIFLC